MKNLRMYAWAAMLIVMASCNDDETSASLTTDEQVEMIAASLGESGFASSAEQSAVYADESLESESGKLNACGYSTTETVSVTNPVGTLITYSYSYEYEASLTCSELTPQSLTSSFNYSGEFDAPRLSSGHTGAGALEVTALDEASLSYVINGLYSRIGGFESKVRNKNTGNSSVELTIEDVLVNKTSYEIESGTATATITGVVAGTAFNFTATIEFLGDGMATITVNGKTYTNNLETGEITKQ